MHLRVAHFFGLTVSKENCENTFIKVLFKFHSSAGASDSSHNITF